MNYRKGMKVKLVWRVDDRDPPAGMHGRVAPMFLPGGGMRCTAGPLVYVEWQNGMQCGVLRSQLVRAES